MHNHNYLFIRMVLTMFYLLFKILRFIFCLLDVIIITSITFVCAFLPKSINKYFIRRLFRLVCSSFIHLIGRSPHIHEKFQSKLPKQYILISNHPSGYDILLLNAIFPVFPLAKDDVRKWFLLGKIAESAGTIFVKRGDKGSRHASKEACREATKQGKNVLIYPEGGCFGKHLRPFKYGAFEISMDTNIPILPVYLQYEAENCFEWGDYGLVRHLLNLIKAVNKNAHCYVFNPIYPDGFENAQEYAQYVQKLYAKWEAKYRLVDYIPIPAVQDEEENTTQDIQQNQTTPEENTKNNISNTIQNEENTTEEDTIKENAQESKNIATEYATME